MPTEIEKIKKRLIKKSEKNKVPYYHELMKFKVNIEKGFQKLKIKYEKLQKEDDMHETLLDEYRKANNSNKL